MTYPQVEMTDDIEKNQRWMDVLSEEGFVFIDEGEKTDIDRNLNYVFFIESPLARGGIETLSLSYIITEADPNISFYKEKIKECVDNIKKDSEIYFAFRDDIDSEKMNEAKKRIENALESLDFDLRKREIETIGYMEDIEGIKNHSKIHIPIDLNELDGDHKYLLIFKEESDGSFRIVGYPTAKPVYKISVLNDELGLSEHTMIIEAFREMGSKIIATSGICQGTNICVFEAYIEYDGDEKEIKTLRNDLKDKIKSQSIHYPIISSTQVPDGKIIVRSSE